MSAPTPAPGDDRPREGYYPDPSIPGYVRYWNGAAWVPGTSRPAPAAGERLPPPPGADASVEETGPHFFDEDPVAQAAPPGDPHGTRPAPGTAWGADRQPAWPAARGADPRVPHATAGAAGQGAAAPPPGDTDPGTFVFRRPVTGARPAPDAASGTEGPADEGTMTFRAVPPQTPRAAASDDRQPQDTPAPAPAQVPASAPAQVPASAPAQVPASAPAQVPAS
ncbi:DUF2510 domain-containing protein, partial [Streptomyces sp. NPDC000134]|uniref:DUF2510 domain-containing protein n=1 Tax=Streptomyces sp. NPDC000134 TaxID=3364536 RepID=UPI0036D193A7